MTIRKFMSYIFLIKSFANVKATCDKTKKRKEKTDTTGIA